MEEDQNEQQNERLWVIEQKLLSLGHLIGQQNPNNTLPMPDDMEAINKGIEMLLTDLALDLSEIREALKGVAPIAPTTPRGKKAPLTVIEYET